MSGGYAVRRACWLAVLVLASCLCTVESRAGAPEVDHGGPGGSPTYPGAINQTLAALARDAPPGSYPKYLSGRQTYWTVIGVNGDAKEALINEEGMIEVDDGVFSIEPFLYNEGKLITWSAVQTRQELAAGYLPIPSVTWLHEPVGLTVTAFAGGEPGRSTLYARYRVSNHGEVAGRWRLFLAVRPFQVNPPWQSLKRPGGAAPIRELRFENGKIVVNKARAVIPLTPAQDFGAAAFQEGPITEFLRRGEVPARSALVDPAGYASGVLEYILELPPHGARDVVVAVPFHGLDLARDAQPRSEEEAGARFEAELGWASRSWEDLLGRVVIRLPVGADDVVRTMKSTLAYILINRDGPAIQPGSRTYARSWIRDGAITSVALLEMGFPDEARKFIRWFGQYQYADGKIPCCVDERGADPTPEHDSHGEFIYAVAEYYRHTHDAEFLVELWPCVRKAANYLDALRRQRLTDEFRSGAKRKFRGLMPESISHEGYARNPVHSYWDDFFALRGFKDAAELASAMGDKADAARLAAVRDSFRSDLVASVARSMADHDIDYVPGSADLGDFDPTATAIALAPCGEMASLPQAALMRTFDRYYAYFQDRRTGRVDWDAYTAYEMRNVTPLMLLGHPDRALEVLQFFLDGRRPTAWNQWAEITWRDAGAPKFIGDMPHTWVGATFVQAVRRMLAYESAPDRALVLAAGIPRQWITSPGGVSVEGLPTHHGVLNYTLEGQGQNSLRMQVRGDLSMPPGKIIVRPGMGRPIKAVSVNGAPVTSFAGDQAVISEFPADVVLEY